MNDLRSWIEAYISRRKVFVSFHHADNFYRDEWDKATSDRFINKSVHPGDIDTDNRAEYIARLIRQDFVSNASVVVVLVGPKTYCRKHVDWEIAAALDPRTGGRSGLVGFLLPHHPNYGSAQYDPALVPGRLVDNLESEYAALYQWPWDWQFARRVVNEAFDKRLTSADKARNGRLQMTYNICD